MRQIFRPLGPLEQNGQMLGQPVKSQTEPGQIHGTWMSIWGLPKNLSRDFHINFKAIITPSQPTSNS